MKNAFCNLIIRAVLLLSVFTLSAAYVQAQCTLKKGDVAFVGYDMNDDGNDGTTRDDKFSFVILRDIPSATEIYFTDLGWTTDVNGVDRFQDSDKGKTDGVIKWTANQAYNAGTVVTVNCKFLLTADKGTVAAVLESYDTRVEWPALPNEYMNLAEISGDQLFAFTGNYLSNPTLLGGMAINTPSGWGDLAYYDTSAGKSNLPSALSSNAQNLSLTRIDPTDPGVQDAYTAQYIGGTTGSALNIISAINSTASWKISPQADPTAEFSPLAAASGYTVSAPVITTQPADALNLCKTASATFTVVADATACSYKWQIYNTATSAWENLTATTPYSNVTTATLAISNVSALEGKRYRVIVYGATPVTSNEATIGHVAALTISDGALTAARTGVAYSYDLSVTGGKANYTYAVNAGSTLPAGLSLSAAGKISGTPTAFGSYTFTVKVTDACSTVQTKALTLDVAPAAPAAPTASTVTYNSFSVNWSAVTGASSYTLDVSTAADFSSFVSGYEDVAVAGTSKQLTGLSSETIYYFRVRAVGATGTSANSASGSQKTDVNPSTSVVSIAGVNTNVATNATSVNYTVTFAAAVTGVDASDFALIKPVGLDATIGTPSGSGKVWTVPVNSISGSGTLRLDFTGTTGVTPNVGAAFTAGEVYTIDQTLPTLTSVSVPASGTYKSGDVLTFSIKTSESVAVSGTPQLGITIGSTTRQASYFAAASTSMALRFTYTVAAGELDNDGITIGTLGLNGGTIKDGVGNNATLTLNAVGSTSGVLVDAVAPKVVSIVRLAPATESTNENLLTFRVTFSESLDPNAVNFADFSATGSTASVVSYVPSASGDYSAYDIRITGGDLESYTGGVGLAIASSNSLTDLAGNGLSSITPTGANEKYILDNTPPTITGISNGGSYNSDKTITIEDGATAKLNGTSFISGSTVSNEGSYTIVAIDGSSNTTTYSFIIDKTAPVVTGVANNGLYNTNKTISFNEGSATLDEASFSNNASVSAEGEHTLVVTDVAGNSTSVSFKIDKTAPATPEDFIANAKDSKLELSWKANTEADLASYKIYWGTTANPSTELVSITSSDHAYTHTSLSNGTTYYYTIVAFDEAGNQSTVSSVISGTPKQGQTITFNALTPVTYGDASFELSATASSNETVEYTSSNTAIATISGKTVTIKGAGSVKITAKQSGTAAYSAADNVEQTLVVNQKALTITASNKNKTYGDALSFAGTEFESSTLVGSDAISSVTLSSTGAASTAAASSTGYDILVSAAQGTGLSNYDITYVKGILNVAKKTITATAQPASKIYNGDATASITFDELTSTHGKVGDDDLTVSYTSASYNNTSAGTAKAITINGLALSGTAKDNYSLNAFSATGEIKRKALTVTAKKAGKTYDANAYNGGNGVEFDGLLESETASVLSGTLNYGGNSQGAVNAGTYTITPSGLSSDNYDISYANGSLIIDKKVLTVTAKDQTKTYDGTEYSNGNGLSYSGFAGDDDASVLSGTLVYSGNSQGAKNAGEYKLIPGGLSAENYELSFAQGTLTIGKKALTVTADNQSKTYGEANPALTVTYSGLVNNETALSPAPSVTTTATELSGVGAYDIEVSGEASNYEVTFKKGTLTVTKKTLTVTADNQSKTYGEANPALTVTYSGLVNNETALSPAPGVTTTATELSGVGAYDIEVSGEAANYEITFKKGTLTVNKKALTVTADNQSKTYGEANPALTVTYSGLVNNETALSPAPSVTTTATELSAVGAYDIEVSGEAANYEVTFKKGTLTVGKKALTVTADNQSKTYGEANPALTVTYSGLVNNETALSPAPSVTTTATELSGVGAYDIEVSGEAANYEVTFKKGTLTVNKKALTVTADNQSKTYGEANPALTVTYSGLVNNETALSPAPSVSTTATELSGVGAYDIEVSGEASNYEVTFKKGTLTVNKKALTVTADNQSKTYGEANPALTVTYSGLVNNETALSPAPSVTTTTTELSAVGAYDIEVSGEAANYEVTFKKGTLTVGKKALTVTADNQSKTYGEANPALTVTYSGLVNNETALSPAPSVTTTATELSGVGAYDIEVSGEAANYEVTFKKGTLTVNKKALTVTADNQSKTYGEANPALTVTYSGLVNNETALSPAPGVTTTATELSGVGAYDIEVSGEAANYEVTFKKGTLTVGKKALTVTADNQSKTYGEANPALTVTYSGLVNNETALSPAPSVTTTATELSGVGAYDIEVSGEAANYEVTFKKGTLTVNKKALTVTADNQSKTYGEANPALTVTYSGLVNNETALSPAPSVTTTATELSGVGAYDIEVSGEAANYEVTFKKGTLTVGKKALTVTADNQSKTYGEANPALTVTYSGLVNNETALSPAPGVTTTATELSGVGAYDIEVSGEAANYEVTFKKGTLTVNKKALTVTADNQSKTYGEANPALTVTYSGLVNNETALSPAPSVNTTATQLSGVGSYNILASGTAANYEVTFNKGTLTIGKKALTVTAENKTKTYGDVNPALSVTYSGLVNGETALSPAPSVTTTATTLSGAGSYDILASGTAANYEVTFNKGTLTIGKKALTVTAENKTKTYGDVNPALSVTYSGLVNGETALNPAPAVTTTATALSGVGTYDIMASGEAANYNVSYVSGSLTVTKKTLTITADNKEKFQGLALPAFSASYNGFVNNETSAVLTTQPVFATTADAMSPQGTYPISVSGATAANYSIIFVPGTLTVKPGFPTSITLAATSLFENAAAGTLAGTLSSTSDDPSANFTYTLVSGTGSADNALFKISGNQLQTNAVLNFENKSSFSVLVRSTTQYGLSLDKQFSITLNNVNEQPTLNNMANSVICYTPAEQRINISGITAGEDLGQTTQITISTSNNRLFEDIQVSQANDNGNAQIRYTLAEGASGAAVINVMVTDNGGTSNGGVNTILKSFTLNVNPLPLIAITSDKGTTLSKGEVAVLKADVSVANNGLTYIWSNAGGILSGQNTQNLTVRPTETTTYTVTVKNANNCESSQSITIEVNADYQVVDGTNIVTPNGDGVNDNFVIRNIDMYPNNVVKIFDRAGRLIYSKTNYGNEWNGTLNGAPLAEDTYYYIVDFGVGKPKIKGFITIVRDR